MLKRMVDGRFWRGRRVLITGHTGFKGSWLTIWLNELGAETYGYALTPSGEHSIFRDAGIAETMRHSIYGSVLDAENVLRTLNDTRPEIVFHLAAQPLVRASYENPIETFATNVLGTAHVLEAIRKCRSTKAFVNITTDKVYENQEWIYGYREVDRLGGFDPYSSSKACSELVTAAYRNSYFNEQSYDNHLVSVATARSGNVIGGGDWAQDRLVPDVMRAFATSHAISLRYPNSTRPWQHVLEPLSGYLLLAESLCTVGPSFSGAWNFGPRSEDVASVGEVANRLAALWGSRVSIEIDQADHPHETRFLSLDSSKARMHLGWVPHWDLQTSLEKAVEWYRGFFEGQDLLSLCRSQINSFNR